MVIEDEVRRLTIRRHRHSPEVARELDTVWLHPESGSPPYSGPASALFPWTLAKAFLSSPAALLESIKERIGRLGKYHTAAQEREIVALLRLEVLARKADDISSGKFSRLLSYL